MGHILGRTVWLGIVSAGSGQTGSELAEVGQSDTGFGTGVGTESEPAPLAALYDSGRGHKVHIVVEKRRRYVTAEVVGKSEVVPVAADEADVERGVAGNVDAVEAADAAGPGTGAGNVAASRRTCSGIFGGAAVAGFVDMGEGDGRAAKAAVAGVVHGGVGYQCYIRSVAASDTEVSRRVSWRA